MRRTTVFLIVLLFISAVVVGCSDAGASDDDGGIMEVPFGISMNDRTATLSNITMDEIPQ